MIRPSPLNTPTVNTPNVIEHTHPGPISPLYPNATLPCPVFHVSAPSAPDALNATQGTDEGSIILEWDHPEIANGDIKKYEVIYWKCDENEEDDSIDISLSGGTTSVEVTLLDPGSTYYMRVRTHGRL